MRWATCMAVGLAAALAGCGDQAQTQSDAEAKALRSRYDSLKRENETLKTSIDTLRAETAAADRKMYGLKQENQSLKRELDSARAAAAKAAVASKAAAGPAAPETAVTPGAGSGGGFALPPGVPAPPAADPSQTIAGLEKTVADLEDRITAARAKVAQARSNISDVSRSTIDQATVVPPGGIIKGGTVYKKEALIVEPYFQYIAVGPVTRRGDFRNQREKDDALKKAREEAAPLEQELKSLQAQQAAARVNLLKQKAAAKPAATPGETPAQPPAPPQAKPAENPAP